MFEKIDVNCESLDCHCKSECCFLPTEYISSNNETVDIMFIGQGGGSQEREQVRPFVGKSGELLKKVIYDLLDKNDFCIGVAFSNTIRNNPDNNREPYVTEVKECIKYLNRDIEILIKKGLKVIVPLGNHAKSVILPSLKNVPMSKCNGIVYRLKNGLVAIPTYHPSSILRQLSINHGQSAYLEKLIDSMFKAMLFTKITCQKKCDCIIFGCIGKDMRGQCTCEDCEINEANNIAGGKCPYMGDPYNTDGDCLMLK